MGPCLTDAQRRLLRVIFERGAESAALALSKWLGQEVHLTVNEVELVELAQASELLGPADSLVAACTIELAGPLTGWVLLVFEDRSGLALVDLLLHLPIGTTVAWGELEQSAAKETSNIVGCAYINALAAHLPSTTQRGRAQVQPAPPSADEIVPSPPTFLHEFAGSLLQFALMEQALELDQVLLVRSEFAGGQQGLNLHWSLLFVPTREALNVLVASLV